ncbi:MAG: PIN domain-containing protein [bacterium]|nr:PIN domain-containing protein [bacterium]
MSQPIYVFDTNIISELLRRPDARVGNLIRGHQQDRLILCESVIYEIERGLKHRNATKQLERFQKEVVTYFQIMPIQLADWKRAGVMWAVMRSDGRQLSDIDLLVASVAIRLGGVVVTDDRDFDQLPVQTENWLHE